MVDPWSDSHGLCDWSSGLLGPQVSVRGPCGARAAASLLSGAVQQPGQVRRGVWVPGSGGLLMGKFSGGSEPPDSASVGSWSSGQTPGLGGPMAGGRPGFSLGRAPAALSGHRQLPCPLWAPVPVFLLLGCSGGPESTCGWVRLLWGLSFGGTCSVRSSHFTDGKLRHWDASLLLWLRDFTHAFVCSLPHLRC